MKSLLLAFAILSSMVAHADVVKIFDGTSAVCQSKADVASHTIYGAYRPVTLRQNGDFTVVEIEFLKCVEKNGEFAFERDMNFDDKETLSPYEPQQHIRIKRKKLELVANDLNGESVVRGSLVKKASGLFEASLKLPESSMIDFHVQSVIQITDLDTGVVLDEGLDAYGGFRLIIR